jgi:membrane dipeptidase
MSAPALHRCRPIPSRPLAAALAALGLAGCGSGGETFVATEQAVARLHRSAIVVDTHSDTTPRFQDPQWKFSERHALGDMDLPRIRQGGLDVEFWSIYMGERPEPGSALREARERIAAVQSMVQANGDAVVLADGAEAIRAAVARGKFVSVMGIEGGHIIEEDLGALREFRRMGVRYMTLTHSFHTSWADSSGTGLTGLPPLHHGLTGFGRQVVREMNAIGMLVDVSHASDETFFAALEESRAPVIASHSSCRAIFDHPRNLSDEQLRALADNGGVVMINFFPGYLDAQAAAAIEIARLKLEPRIEELRRAFSGDPIRLQRERQALLAANPFPTAPLGVLLDHFDHAIEVAGEDHVGIGADWDGVPSMPDGLQDVSGLPALTRGLLERGHSPAVVRKVLGENLLRVLQEAEEVAARSDAG